MNTKSFIKVIQQLNYLWGQPIPFGNKITLNMYSYTSPDGYLKIWLEDKTLQFHGKLDNTEINGNFITEDYETQATEYFMIINFLKRMGNKVADPVRKEILSKSEVSPEDKLRLLDISDKWRPKLDGHTSILDFEAHDVLYRASRSKK